MKLEMKKDKNIGVKILAIEDNICDIELIREFMEAHSNFSYELIHAGSFEAALNKINANEIDIILLDLCLPDSQGIETFNKIYSMCTGIPIIILSGLDQEDIAINCVRTGAQDYLVKSGLKGDILVRSIYYAMERKSLQNSILEVNASLKKNVIEKKQELDEANIVLKSLIKNLKEGENEKLEVISFNIEKNIIPLIEELKKIKMYNPNIVEKLEQNIEAIGSNFHRKLVRYKYGLTPTEIKICKLVKSGYLAKEIAEILYVSTTTVNEHKSNIRKKFKIRNTATNLKSFLDELLAK